MPLFERSSNTVTWWWLQLAVKLHNDDALRMNGSHIQFCKDVLCILRKSYYEIQFSGVKVDKEGERKEYSISLSFQLLSFRQNNKRAFILKKMGGGDVSYYDTEKTKSIGFDYPRKGVRPLVSMVLPSACNMLQLTLRQKFLTTFLTF
jgi:hypothetical protein